VYYSVTTEESYGELVAIVMSVLHIHASEHWYLQTVVVVSDPGGPGHTVRCFPCHDVVSARVTLRTGNGNSSCSSSSSSSSSVSNRNIRPTSDAGGGGSSSNMAHTERCN